MEAFTTIIRQIPLPDDCPYKTALNLWSQTSFHAIKYIYKPIYMCLLLSYNNSITYTEHSPNYTVFGLPQTYEMKTTVI